MISADTCFRVLKIQREFFVTATIIINNDVFFFKCTVIDEKLITSNRKYVEDMKGLQYVERRKRTTALTIAILEESQMLNDKQRAAPNGKDKEIADGIRSSMKFVAASVVNPYFWTQEDETTPLVLDDLLAIRFPPQLRTFLTDEQQERLVISDGCFALY